MKLETNPRVLLWLVILASAAAIFFAGLWNQERARAEASRDAALCYRVLRDAGPGFDDVNVMTSTHPRANVYGRVASEEDRVRLEQMIADAVGAAGRARIHYSVRVGPRESDKTKINGPTTKDQP